MAVMMIRHRSNYPLSPIFLTESCVEFFIDNLYIFLKTCKWILENCDRLNHRIPKWVANFKKLCSIGVRSYFLICNEESTLEKCFEDHSNTDLTETLIVISVRNPYIPFRHREQLSQMLRNLKSEGAVTSNAEISEVGRRQLSQMMRNLK